MSDYRFFSSIHRQFLNQQFAISAFTKFIILQVLYLLCPQQQHLHKSTGLQSWLDQLEKDSYYMEEWAEVRIEGYPKGSRPASEPAADSAAQAVFKEADILRIKMGDDLMTPLALLASLVTPGVGFSYEQMKTFPLTQNEILNVALQNSSIAGAINPTNGKDASSSGAKGGSAGTNQAIAKFCVDKTSLAQQGKIDPIIGRDQETRLIAEVLGRRTKPNVIIVGEPGVGKTALIDGFAINIAEGKVQEYLKGARLFELDLGTLIAGASYKGEIEDRIKGILKELKNYEKAILFIDEIHALLDPERGLSGIVNLMKPELARGEITVIGATTQDEYREFIEQEEAFSRRFEVIKVDEPDDESCIRMLKTLLPLYEEHHALNAEVDCLPEAVRLSRRYVKERRLPDAAIDLVDRTMSAMKMMWETSETELTDMTAKIESLKTSEDKDALRGESLWLFRELEAKISPVLLGRIEDETNPYDFEDGNDVLNFLEKRIITLTSLAGDKAEIVTKQDIAAVVANKTGIPIGKIQSAERERLLNMEEILKNRVIGQDHAIHTLCETILESRSGLTRAGQPIGSFFFLGPTGTGKTELAKSLAEFLFADETALLRFDMSEFKEEHSAALLYGAPPGYVGYKEGGLLVNKIRQKPYSVVLFDEIEKAHPSVFDIFLQILDEGKLHDRLGKVGDFSNSVILFTSNIGSEHIIEEFGKGVIPESTDLMEIMSRHFRPEFLARLSEILPFRPISEEAVVRIFNIQVSHLNKLLENQGITLEISDEAREVLAKEGFTPKYGARPLRKVIRDRLSRPFSRMVVSGAVKKGDKLTVFLDENGNITTKIN
jgi:ATP-dependent Clp protease ATP-binding subunit ClpB